MVSCSWSVAKDPWRFPELLDVGQAFQLCFDQLCHGCESKGILDCIFHQFDSFSILTTMCHQDSPEAHAVFTLYLVDALSHKALHDFFGLCNRAQFIQS